MAHMRLAKREVTDRKELRAIIEKCTVLRIGGRDEEGMFIVPVNYGYEWEEKDGEISLKFYIHSTKEGRKARAFRKDPQVAVELDREGGVIEGNYTCSYSFAYESIMGTGTIRLLEKTEDKRRGLRFLMEHMAPGSPIEFRDEMIEAVDVYEIDVAEFKGKKREKKK